MVRKIIFCSMTPLLNQHIKVLGEEVLAANGFQALYYDFSPLVYPALQKQKTLPQRFESTNYILFTEYEKALQAIEELDEECFVIIVGYYELETYKIYKAISKSKTRYAIKANNIQPSGTGDSGKSISWKIFSIFYRFKLKKIKRLLYKPFFAPLLGIRPPDMCIFGGEKSFELLKDKALVGKNTELLWTHANDYDGYLNKEKNIDQENIAVFIDVGCPKFPWDQHLPVGLTHLTVDKYYPSLCKFFDYVEKSLGVKIVIAAHPKSNHEERPEYFGKRKTVKDQTQELIRKSKFVISHASSALNLVVLEKKPLLFLTTAEYKGDLEYSKRMELMAAPLGKSLINIDDVPHSIDWESELTVNKDLYFKYKQDYIKREDSEKLNTWEILSKRLKQLGW